MSVSESAFIKALNLEPTSKTPIWLMRQAGRYLPEYKAIRKHYKNFLDMCKEPKTCAELALQPIERYELDASILFSDILTIPDAFNLGLSFSEGEGPRFANPITMPSDIDNLKIFDENDLDYVFKTVEETRKALPESLPLIGFCGSPWTLAAYSIEGSGSKTFPRLMKFLQLHSNSLEKLLGLYSDACFIYLKQQVLSGINAIQIFDSWADLLNGDQFEKFSVNPTKNLVRMLKNDSVTKTIPIILFEKASPIEITDIAFDGIACMSLHHTDSLENAKLKFLNSYAIQGNLDPNVLTKSDEDINRHTREITSTMRGYPGFIFNLGHGITPNIHPDKIKIMIDSVRNFEN